MDWLFLHRRSFCFSIVRNAAIKIPAPVPGAPAARSNLGDCCSVMRWQGIDVP
jgi:hypothetical protein